MNAKERAKFRASSKWKKFRLFIKKRFDSLDAITRKPLRKGWNLHHLCMDETKYSDISDPDKFIPLNKQMHETLHNCFRFYKNDEGFLDRLIFYLKRMKELNE